MPPLFCGDHHVEPEFCPQALMEWHQVDTKKMATNTKKSFTLQAKKHLSYLGWIFKYVNRQNRPPELRYISPEGKIFNSLRLACEHCMETQEFGRSSTKEYMINEEPASNGLKHGQKRKSQCDDQSPRIVPEMQKKRGRKPLFQCDYQSPRTVPEMQRKGKCLLKAATNKEIAPQKQGKSGVITKEEENCRTCKSHQATNISQLIERKIVPENAEVHYIDADAPMKRGSITSDGNICCNCCDKKFDLRSFEAHAGTSFRRPALCIFLEEDGRSLLNFNNEDSLNNDGNKSDDLCSICHEGGDMLLCDQCPSVFHTNCLGLEEIPNGKWFCPSCRCGICGLGEFNKNKDEFTENTTSVCNQCEHEFHVGCLRRKGFTKLKARSGGNWFCSNNCEKIFLGLKKMLGKSFRIDDTLSWSILRHNSHQLNTETMMEFHAKLNVALGIMHGSFKPIHEPYTNSDLIEDVIFSKGSELNRLNFQGFYTVLLERGDDVICVATLRIHGDKVAEIPLIATHPRHRRQGMCRRLMDAIEKKLVDLGVKRLILPAAGEVLNTWIDHFRFSKMIYSERMKFLNYTFLYFQRATMCQKLLTGKFAKSESDDESIDLDGNSTDSEVIQERDQARRLGAAM
ncbi:increased DNA methylation 1-like [Macadamia integrifolia]|uniref:increased DNA methylation 1-like n=1 Tax=Macadamia integrifolia TaxID=60698 RepID=UPI001C4ED1A2|nr:increased DNA methylation 1-like [Macadamia integrifolia]